MNRYARYDADNLADINPVTKIIPNKKYKKKEKDILKDNNINVYRFD